MPAETTAVNDGFVSMEGGVDSGRSASIIAENQGSWAVNVTFRGGFPQTRPGWNKRPLDFEDDATQTAFQDGYYQGAGVLNTTTGNTYLVASIAGRLFRVDLNNAYATQEITTGDVNSPTLNQAWFVQAEDTLVIQDGQSKPFLYDGATLVRSGTNQVPVGTAMAYGIGRLWVANGSQYVGGDLAYSNPALGRKSVLYFTENTFLNEGGAFVVPSQNGPITALSFVAAQDTAQGFSHLLVFTRSAIFGFDAPVDRDVWKEVQQPLQKFALIQFGAYSQWGIVPVNGDLFFRAEDGWRSFYFARRDFGGWGNTPISNEVTRVTNFDDTLLLGVNSGANFDNRLLMTCQPNLNQRGIYHLALGVLDFDLISGMRDKQPPAWEGVWTGLRILQILTATVSGIQRCFAFVLGADDAIELWELSKTDRFDNGETRIACALETRSMNAQAPFVPKRLDGGDLSLDSISGRVDFLVRFRPDLHPCWSVWHQWCESAKYRQCENDSCQTSLPNFQQNEINRRGLPQPPDITDSANCALLRDGFEFQTRIEWTGAVRLKRHRIRMTVLPDQTYGRIAECCP